MVYELYELMDKDEEIKIFAIIQTITMRSIIIGHQDKVQGWMDSNGLTEEKGWNLNEAYKIDYRDYNQLISP